MGIKLGASIIPLNYNPRCQYLFRKKEKYTAATRFSSFMNTLLRFFHFTPSILSFFLFVKSRGLSQRATFETRIRNPNPIYYEPDSNWPITQISLSFSFPRLILYSPPFAMSAISGIQGQLLDVTGSKLSPFLIYGAKFTDIN